MEQYTTKEMKFYSPASGSVSKKEKKEFSVTNKSTATGLSEEAEARLLAKLKQINEIFKS